MTVPHTNLGHLEVHDKQLGRLGMLAQLVATNVGLYVSREEAQCALVRRLQAPGILPCDMAQLFRKQLSMMCCSFTSSAMTVPCKRF